MDDLKALVASWRKRADQNGLNANYRQGLFHAADELEAALSRPAGGEWVMVPAELTEEMRNEGFGSAAGKLGARALWRAMLATAPTPPSSGIYEAYMTWPEDIRKKLSMHDLRRMSGWAPATARGDNVEPMTKAQEAQEANLRG